MTKPAPKLLDTVALLTDIPVEWLTLLEPSYASISALPSGLVGAVVEVYQSGPTQVYRVEFSDSQGRECALAMLKASEILVLQSELAVC